MSRGLFALLAFLSLLAGIGEASASKKLALVIGNDTYPNLAAHEQLRKARNDARTTAETLRALGFEGGRSGSIPASI